MSHQLITFWRILKAGLQNFARSLALAIAAITVMVITLSIVLFSAIANSTFTYTVKGLTDKIDISVYLKDEVSDSQRDKLINNIKQLENVKSVNYLTKEQALEAYKEDNKNENIYSKQETNNLTVMLTISIMIFVIKINNDSREGGS